MSPSEVPTGLPSQSPSHHPTVTPIEELVRACYCDKALQCVDDPYEEGSELLLCVLEDPTAILLESIQSLHIQKGGISQIAVENGAFIGNTFAIQAGQSSGRSSFLIVLQDLEKIFEFGTDADLILEGSIQYSRKGGNLRGTNLSNEDSHFNFRVSIPTIGSPKPRADIEPVILDGDKASDSNDDIDNDGDSDEAMKIGLSTIIAFAVVGLALFFIFQHMKARRATIRSLSVQPVEDDTTIQETDDEADPEDNESKE